LSQRYGELWLIIECDGLEIHEFYNGHKFYFIFHDILYYYVKLWIKLFYIWLICHFENISIILTLKHAKRNIGYIVMLHVTMSLIVTSSMVHDMCEVS
jgi:hypothetical protein